MPPLTRIHCVCVCVCVCVFTEFDFILLFHNSLYYVGYFSVLLFYSSSYFIGCDLWSGCFILDKVFWCLHFCHAPNDHLATSYKNVELSSNICLSHRVWWSVDYDDMVFANYSFAFSLYSSLSEYYCFSLFMLWSEVWFVMVEMRLFFF